MLLFVRNMSIFLCFHIVLKRLCLCYICMYIRYIIEGYDYYQTKYINFEPLVLRSDARQSLML